MTGSLKGKVGSQFCAPALGWTSAPSAFQPPAPPIPQEQAARATLHRSPVHFSKGLGVQSGLPCEAVKTLERGWCRMG